MKSNTTMTENSNDPRSNEPKTVLEMTQKEARKFFLKETSYSNLDLPNYISFQPLINKAEKILKSREGNNNDIDNIVKKDNKLGNLDNLNYTIYINKDRQYSWRPISLLHPISYVDLVNYITERKDADFGWEQLKERFKKFQSNQQIKCFSIPGESRKRNKTDDGIMILNWWKNIEQQSIAKSLEYSYCLFTDITDFYPSIYTHVICWAIHGKEKCKSKVRESSEWYGGKIDVKIQRMQNNQTNGIPQGSALMDFVSEIILGYLDLKLSERLIKKKIADYFILRYRDDYRIFSNNKNELEIIAKLLHEVMQSLNLKLNSNKTFFSENIIFDSIKSDKLYWEPRRNAVRNSYLNKSNNYKGVITLQKHLWHIKELADKYPNSGMLKKSLTEFYEERIVTLEKTPADLNELVSILANIMLENPNVIPHCTTIIAKLHENVDYSNRLSIVNSILERYKKKPNTEHIEIWLQRLLILVPDSDNNQEDVFNSIITKHIMRPDSVLISKIFPLDWIDEGNINNPIDDIESTSLVDAKEFEKMKLEVSDSEINLFNTDDYQNI